MGIANNDYNWRLVAASDIPANTVVYINSSGKAAISDGSAGKVNGICPQAVKSGERCPVIRGGTISELSGKTAGQRLKVQSADGTLATGGSNVVFAVVKSEDASLAVILTGNLDS